MDIFSIMLLFEFSIIIAISFIFIFVFETSCADPMYVFVVFTSFKKFPLLLYVESSFIVIAVMLVFCELICSIAIRLGFVSVNAERHNVK